MDEWIDGETAISWFCSAISDLACCDIGGQYNCFCRQSEREPKDAMVSKKIVDFALMAIRDVSWSLREELESPRGFRGSIPEAALNKYMKEHAASYQEEYK